MGYLNVVDLRSTVFGFSCTKHRMDVGISAIKRIGNDAF